MDDVRKEDAKCAGKPEGLAGLLAWLKKVGIPIPMPHPLKKLVPPLALVTPEALTEGDAKKVMADVKAAMEEHLGYPVMLVSLGAVQVVPCNCKLCQMRRHAPWN